MIEANEARELANVANLESDAKVVEFAILAASKRGNYTVVISLDPAMVVYLEESGYTVTSVDSGRCLVSWGVSNI